jgi:error-prone DNA polymerase
VPEAANPKIRPAPLPPPPSTVQPCTHAYAELDVTTNFSFLRAASHPDELVFRAAELGYRAIAVTDRNSLAGVVRAHTAAKQAGLKLIVGTRLSFADAPDVLAWVTDRLAYARLCRLLTVGNRRAEKGACQLWLADLLAHAEGLLMALVPPHSPDDQWITTLRRLREAAGDRLSLVASCPYGAGDRRRLEEWAAISRSFDVPLLATNDVHYHDPSRRALQDVLTCIRHGCTLADAGMRLFPNGERYLKPPAQMHRLFADYPSALRRTIEIAERCCFSLDELRYEYPDELAPSDETPLQHLERLTWAGVTERYPQGVPPNVADQVQRELNLIGQLQFEAYFLTVHDLVRFARGRGILCQGRGSAANSAVCYCLGVTSVDPAMGELLFERFISAARNEPPDIDIDFEHERREEVIQYVYEKYGRERSGMTGVVITYRGRSAVRDVGKAMGLSLDLVDEMAGKLDWWDAGTLAEQRIREIGLDPTDRTVRGVISLTGQLLGFPRHLSQHVGGMVMTRGPLCELVPITNAAMEGRTVIEWDKDDIDALGILKVDVLALGMLTCIAKCMKLIDAQNPTAPPLQLHTIPREDPGVYEMVSDADTIGVFQIESRAQMSMLPRLRPDKFYDLVIEVAIVRPGPIQGDMVHPYLRRRNKEEPVTYPSQALEQVLSRTLGVPLFQEQAMKIAMVAAGFSADEADRLRRAMAAWRRSGAIEEFHQKIVTGMLANGYELAFAEQCFNQIKGFGEYGFPESHAASFALLVYASAWLKRYHPAAFAAALLNSQPMGFYAPAQIVRDAKEHGVEVRPLDVNCSEWDCTLESLSSQSSEKTGKEGWGRKGPVLRLGLRLVKGLSSAHAETVVRERHRGGPFAAIPIFQRRTAFPRHVLERLAQADAFGSLGPTRRGALWEVLALADDDAPLFDSIQSPMPAEAVALPAMPLGQEVMADYATAGLSLKQHPMALLRAELAARGIITAATLSGLDGGRWAKVAGLVLIRQRPATASGIVFETLEDETGIVNLIIRPNIYERHRAAARHARVLLAEGNVERQGQVIHIMAKRLHDLSDLLGGYRFASRDFH